MFLTVQIGHQLNETNEEARGVMREAQRSLSRLAEIQDENYWDTKASVESMAMATKNTAEAAERLSAYIKKLDSATEVILTNTDGRMEEITKGTVTVLERTQGAAGAVEKQVNATGYQAEQLLADARGAVRNLEALAGRPELAQSVRNVEAATAQTAKTAENLEQATASIRDMLSPKKKSFWRRVLELAIPRPTVGLGR